MRTLKKSTCEEMQTQARENDVDREEIKIRNP